MKVLTVIGARPQFIKAAVVSNAFRVRNIEEFMIHTGQHFDENMSKVFFEEMEISKPHANLGISGGTHGSMTGEMLIEVEKLRNKSLIGCLFMVIQIRHWQVR